MNPKKKERSLLGLASMLIGFLFIVLLKSNGVYGSQGVWQETAVPSLIQIDKENQQLSLENEKLELEVAKYAQSLEVYSKLAVTDAQAEYNEVINKFPI